MGTSPNSASMTPARCTAGKHHVPSSASSCTPFCYGNKVVRLAEAAIGRPTRASEILSEAALFGQDLMVRPVRWGDPLR
jgi:hypothetical protein